MKIKNVVGINYNDKCVEIKCGKDSKMEYYDYNFSLEDVELKSKTDWYVLSYKLKKQIYDFKIIDKLNNALIDNDVYIDKTYFGDVLFYNDPEHEFSTDRMLDKGDFNDYVKKYVKEKIEYISKTEGCLWWKKTFLDNGKYFSYIPKGTVIKNNHKKYDIDNVEMKFTKNTPIKIINTERKK